MTIRLTGTGNQVINQICWWGYYGTAATFTPGNECWRIRILFPAKWIFSSGLNF